MLKRICALLFPGLFLFSLSAWGFDFKPGQYEVSVRMEMPGMPVQMPPQTVMQCLKEENPVPASSPDAQGCEITDMNTSGNTLTYTMECSQQGMEAKSVGKLTYKGNSFEGTTETTMGSGSEGMTVKTVIRGRRIGNCE